MDPANGLRPVDIVHRVLDEDSVSWKGGIDWTATPGLLLYANVSKGYKAGTVPVLGATTVTHVHARPENRWSRTETGLPGAGSSIVARS